MADNTNIGITVEAWADITVKEWIKKASMLGISPGSPLTAQRFMHHVVTSADGDPRRIEFIYDYYLMFVNWGVGRGVTLDDRDAMIAAGRTKRRKKPFIDDVFFTQLKILAYELAEKYGRKSALVVSRNLVENNLQ